MLVLFSSVAATQLTTPLYDGADAVPVVKIETVDTSGPSAVKSEEDAKQPVVNGTTATEHGAMPSSSEDSKPIKTEESQQSNVVRYLSFLIVVVYNAYPSQLQRNESIEEEGNLLCMKMTLTLQWSTQQ